MDDLLDVLIIGGGFSGIGLAHEAALHGFRVRLLEAHTLGAGTSANSLRIVHGGFRYLQNAAIGRVLESARAKKLLLERYSDLVLPLPCVMPLARFGARSKIPVRAALAIYKILTASQAGEILSAAAVKKDIALLSDTADCGALLWWDAVVRDPESLIRRVAADATALGAKIDEHAKAISIDLQKKYAVTKVALASDEIELRSKLVVNAAGRNIDHVSIAGFDRPKRNWCRSFNLILNRNVEPRFAVAGRGRGRLLFVVPRADTSVVGTWYLPLGEGDASRSISEQEIGEAITDFNAAFPLNPLSRADVRAAEFGYLPVNDGVDFHRCGRFEPQKYFPSGTLRRTFGIKFTTFMTQAALLLHKAAPLLA